MGEELPVGEEPRHQEAESKLLRAGPWPDLGRPGRQQSTAWGIHAVEGEKKRH